MKRVYRLGKLHEMCALVCQFESAERLNRDSLFGHRWANWKKKSANVNCILVVVWFNIIEKQRNFFQIDVSKFVLSRERHSLLFARPKTVRQSQSTISNRRFVIALSSILSVFSKQNSVKTIQWIAFTNQQIIWKWMSFHWTQKRLIWKDNRS